MRGMVIEINDEQLRTLADLQGFLNGTVTMNFTLRPFHRNIARALLKEPEVYFFDTGLVQGDEGARFGNACAAMLLRHAHFPQDSAGRAKSLHYVSDKEGREIDFRPLRELAA